MPRGYLIETAAMLCTVSVRLHLKSRPRAGSTYAPPTVGSLISQPIRPAAMPFALSNKRLVPRNPPSVDHSIPTGFQRDRGAE